MSTLYLYAWCNITKDRNCRVDNIQDYLTSIRMIPAITIQYQQIELKKNLKLNMSQASVGSSPVNYLEIVQDNKSFYYFIDKANWKSTSTVELELTLDTVNTFASDFSFNKKTHITRQHKDRLEKTRETVITPIGDDSLEWETVPANRYLVLNPWAFENEAYDTFYVAGMSELQSCVITKRYNNEILETYEDVRRLEQNYSGATGVAMQFTHNLHGINISKVLEYETLINDYNNGIYWVIIFVGDPTDMSYSSNGAWTSLFRDYYSEKDVFKRIIDMKEEGLNPPLFKDNYEYKVEDNNSDINWYLVYRANSDDQDSGIQCRLYPSDETSVIIKETLNKAPADFLADTYYYFMPNTAAVANHVHEARTFDNGNNNVGIFMEMVDSDTSSVVGRLNNKYANQNSWFFIAYRDGTDLVVENYTVNENLFGYLVTTKQNTYTVPAAHTVNFRNYEGTTVRYYTSSSKDTDITTIYNKSQNTYNSGYWLAGTSTVSVNSFNTILRTDSQLVKILALPYSFGVKLNEFDDNIWQYDSLGKFLYLNNPNIKFQSILTCDYNPLDNLKIEYVQPSLNDLRNDNNESKLFNSEFYLPKFVYDSFNYQYHLENVDINFIDEYKINNIIYTCSSLINSRFMWQFNIPLKRSTSDYDKLCIAVRNNELPIYSNKYIDYIRSGYNYDVKNKDANLAKGALGVGATAIGGALATGMAVAKIGGAAGSTAGPVGTAIGAGIGAAVGLLAGISNLAISQAQADWSIQQKLDEARRQATSVSGGDDIDLLDIYTEGNKAKYVTYRCSDKVRNTMADLFNYCGYSEDVRAVPDVNTRTWFNFIQCEPVFNENNSVYREYLEDIKQRYQEGVTVYHRVNNTYDWDQVKENWETSLLQGE